MELLGLIKRDFKVLYTFRVRTIRYVVLFAIIVLLKVHTDSSRQLTDLIGGVYLQDFSTLFLNFPYLWCFMIIGPLFLLHDFMSRDLKVFGSQILIKLTKKSNFFRSKMITAVLYTVILNVILLIISVSLYCLLGGTITAWTLVITWLSTCLGSLFFTLLYLCFTVFFSEVIAFLACFVLLLSGWQSKSAFFPGNLSMPLYVLTEKISLPFLAGYLGLLMAAMIIISNHLFKTVEIY